MVQAQTQLQSDHRSGSVGVWGAEPAPPAAISRRMHCQSSVQAAFRVPATQVASMATGSAAEPCFTRLGFAGPDTRRLRGLAKGSPQEARPASWLFSGAGTPPRSGCPLEVFGRHEPQSVGGILGVQIGHLMRVKCLGMPAFCATGCTLLPWCASCCTGRRGAFRSKESTADPMTYRGFQAPETGDSAAFPKGALGRSLERMVQQSIAWSPKRCWRLLSP